MSSIAIRVFSRTASTMFLPGWFCKTIGQDVGAIGTLGLLTGLGSLWKHNTKNPTNDLGAPLFCSSMDKVLLPLVSVRQKTAPVQGAPMQLTTDRVSSGWLRSALIVWRQISDSQHAGLVEALDIPGGTGGVMPLPNDDIRDAMLMVKRTYRPNFLHRKMRCGWKKRNRTPNGRRVINRRRAKGRWSLSA
mmetsp:Transcript_50097/g.95699  ORF Transcript_50097/g.95699 Transcript_50097/m.95699 type:complete len:190 (+) Transcript_50097:110-679(+)